MPWSLCAEPEGVDLMIDEGPDSCVRCDQPTHFPTTDGLCESCNVMCVEDLPAPDAREGTCEYCGKRVLPTEQAIWSHANGKFKVSHRACEENANSKKGG